MGSLFIGRWVTEHFRGYRRRNPWSFCWRITIEGFLVTAGVAILLSFLDSSTRTDLEGLEPEVLFVTIVLIGPIFETLTLQAFPVSVARHLGLGFRGQILMSVIPFAALHFPAGFSAGVAAGVIGGFYSAFTYAHWREHSSWTAFWVTTVSHAVHNLLAFVMITGFS